MKYLFVLLASTAIFSASASEPKKEAKTPSDNPPAVTQDNTTRNVIIGTAVGVGLAAAIVRGRKPINPRIYSERMK